MMPTYFAKIENGLIVAVHFVTQEFLEANPERYAGTWVNCANNEEGQTHFDIGYTYDGTNFIAPPAIER